MKRTTVSERALVLAPRGRDAAIAGATLKEGGIEAVVCTPVEERALREQSDFRKAVENDAIRFDTLGCLEDAHRGLAQFDV
jgi:hypothetical protein